MGLAGSFAITSRLGSRITARIGSRATSRIGLTPTGGRQ